METGQMKFKRPNLFVTPPKAMTTNTTTTTFATSAPFARHAVRYRQRSDNNSGDWFSGPLFHGKGENSSLAQTTTTTTTAVAAN